MMCPFDAVQIHTSASCTFPTVEKGHADGQWILRTRSMVVDLFFAVKRLKETDRAMRQLRHSCPTRAS